jgi:hypothetical protein
VLPFKKKKILTYVLVFDQYEIIRKSLDFITRFSDQLEIVIIENPSASSPKIAKLIDVYGQDSKVKRHYLFKENIAANAFWAVLENERSEINRQGLVILTDGDLVCSDAGWLEEETNILKRSPFVFACGISLDMSNLPLKTFPEAINWVPPDESEQNDYFEARTGLHLLSMTSKNLLGFLDWIKGRDAPFVDSTLHYYCYEVLKKHWARTKKTNAYHLTWDLYNDLGDDYTKLKVEKSHKDIWYHQKTAGFKLKKY